MAGLSGPVLAGAATLGWSVYPEHQGRGYATEALRALVAHLLADPAVDLVRATIDPENAASLRVAEKAGLRRCGLARNAAGGAMVELATPRRRAARG